MIKKPTTTMAPTTMRMEMDTGLGAGSIAAIFLAILLIIIIVLIVLFAVYLWKTGKYRYVQCYIQFSIDHTKSKTVILKIKFCDTANDNVNKNKIQIDSHLFITLLWPMQ